MTNRLSDCWVKKKIRTGGSECAIKGQHGRFSGDEKVLYLCSTYVKILVLTLHHGFARCYQQEKLGKQYYFL